MGLIKWIEKWTAKNRYSVIYDRVSNEAYLERNYLFIKDRDTFPFNIFLHKFLKSDADDLHDHPWNYITIILKGGYWEHTPDGKHWRGPGHIRRCSAKSLHRIELDPSIEECYTLFIPGKQTRDWGFIRDGEWVYWETYLDDKMNQGT